MNEIINSNQEVSVEISSQFKGHITPRGLILPQGAIEFETRSSKVGPGHEGFIGKIVAPKYHFEIGFTENSFYIIRNDNTLHYPLKVEPKTKSTVHFFAMWDIDFLKITVLDDLFRKSTQELTQMEKETEVKARTLTLKTIPTIPPNSLLGWARGQSIIPEISYDTVEDFYEVVASSFESIDDTIRSLGSVNAFWDISYDGRKILSKKPKNEIDIHPTINAFLFYISLAKNFEVVPEYQIGGGRLDFLISAQLSNGKFIHACVEFKHAHSEDIEKGLLKQLPEYMKAKACDFGIYCVLFFKGEFFDKPTEHDTLNLRLLLEKERRRAGLRNIRTMILDVSHPTPPSKR